MMADLRELGWKRHFFEFESESGTNSLFPETAADEVTLPASSSCDRTTTTPGTRASRATEGYASSSQWRTLTSSSRTNRSSCLPKQPKTTVVTRMSASRPILPADFIAALRLGFDSSYQRACCLPSPPLGCQRRSGSQ